jgi:hypothetical protein
MRFVPVALLTVVLSACSTTTSNMQNAASPSDLPGYTQGYDRVYSASLDAVALLSWKVTLAEKDAGLITAETPMSLTTSGDNVTIHIFAPDSTRGDSLTRVGFSSGTDQAFDWGKNSKNQRKFYERLDGVLNGALQPK